MKIIRLREPKAQAGVTLVELMIATTIFAIVLLILIAAFLFVSNDYIKGYVSSQTQEVTRAIVQQVSQEIELNGATVGPPISDPTSGSLNPTYNVQIGNNMYSYLLNSELGVDSPHALVFNSSNALPQDLTSPTINGVEMLGAHMRLGEFNIQQSNVGSQVTYTITVNVYYGDAAVLTPVSIPGSSPTANYVYSCPDLTFGGQFCASSILSATVIPRVSGGG